jgi:hypothetical protein
MTPNSPWNEETLALLKQRWTVDGFAASTISNELNTLGYATTKNSVIGKVHRLKLLPPETKKGVTAERARQLSKKIKKKAKLIQPILIRGKKYNPIKHKEAVVPKTKPDGSNAVLLRDSKKGQCRAIIGYVNGICALAMVCGEPTVSHVSSGVARATSWCEYHKKAFFMEARKKYE